MYNNWVVGNQDCHLPLIVYRRPFGVEKEFFVQLFLEIEQDQTAPPSSEKLIKKMFHEQNISFTTVNNTCSVYSYLI